MKHLIYLLSILFLITGCDLFNSTSPDNPDNPENTSAKYAKEYWGEWLRMDTSETWYISSNAIKINNKASSKTVSLTKQSDRVIEVTESGRKYYLYASRVGNTSFTGKIADFGQAAQSSRAVAGGKGFIKVVIEDLNDKTNTATATTDGAGNFTANDIIPGNEYQVTPEGGTPMTVTPIGDGDNVGTITITNGVNFKTSIKPTSSSTDMTRLYANMNAYTFNIVIENTGTTDCTAATYSLDFASDLIAESVPVSQILGTIEPGKTKTIEIKVRCQPIQNEYEYKEIGITINDPISGKQWQDSVSLKFNKAPVNFNIKSNSAVSGVIIAPTAQAYSFSKVTSATVTVPWSAKDYLVVFSGATADTEAVYSLGIGVTPDSNFNAFTDTANYEPNNTETVATAIAAQDKIMSYLHKNDIDYYKVNLGTTAPVFNPVSLTNFKYADTGGNGDNILQPHESAYLDIRVKNNVNATINVSSVVLTTTNNDVTIDEGTRSIGDLTAGYYKTLTDNTSSYSYESGAALLYTSLSTKAFKFTVSETCPVGTNIPFTVTFRDSWGNAWTDSFTIPVVRTGASIAINTPISSNVSVREAANGNADGKVNPRESHYLDLRVKNTGTSNVLGLTASITTTNNDVTIDEGTRSIGDLTAGYYKTLTDNTSSYSYESGAALLYTSLSTKAFKFTVSETCPVGTNIPFTVAFTDSWGNAWTDSFTIPVVGTGASIAINTPVSSNVSVREVSGTINNIANPGEQLYLDLRIKNLGTSNALGLIATFTTTNSDVTIDEGTRSIGDLTAGYYKTLTDNTSSYSYESGAALLYTSLSTKAFKFTISATCPAGTNIPFTVTFIDSWGNTWTDTLDIEVE